MTNTTDSENPDDRSVAYGIQNEITEKPRIIKTDSYVIIGSKDHGWQIPEEGILYIENSLKDVCALKMEGAEENLAYFHPLSTDSVSKRSMGVRPVSFFPENDGEDIGTKLLRYGIPEELIEAYIPCNAIRYDPSIMENPDRHIVTFEMHKNLNFGFMNVQRGLTNFISIFKYWVSNCDASLEDWDHFAYDFEKFIGDVREYEFWFPDVKKFMKEYDGEKIAVCCGAYHISFIQMVLDGGEPTKPDWRNHIDLRREDTTTPQTAEYLKQIYSNLQKALKTDLNLNI